jgi:hypothetical protein
MKVQNGMKKMPKWLGKEKEEKNGMEVVSGVKYGIEIIKKTQRKTYWLGGYILANLKGE